MIIMPRAMEDNGTWSILQIVVTHLVNISGVVTHILGNTNILDMDEDRYGSC